MSKPWVIVIDGPSGAGKSTVSRQLSKKLNFTHLDTGALYRCIGLAADENNIEAVDSEALFEFAKACRIRFEKERVFLNDEDVTEKIRTEKVSQFASAYGKLPAVRKALLSHQRACGEKGGIVAEGRDLGTVVFPHAELKFFLTASPKERAKRRFDELKQKKATVTLDEVIVDIESRDKRDSERSMAPLKKASDAVEVDTTALTIDQVVDEMYTIYQGKKNENSR